MSQTPVYDPHPVVAGRRCFESAMRNAADSDTPDRVDIWLEMAASWLPAAHDARPHVRAAIHLDQHSEAWNRAMTNAQAILEESDT